VPQVQLAQSVLLDKRVLLVYRAPQVLTEAMALQVPQVLLVRLDRLDKQVPLVYRAPQV
jgi:hypothetical protein